MDKEDLSNKDFYINGIYIKEEAIKKLKISASFLNVQIKKLKIPMLLKNYKFTDEIIKKYFMQGNKVSSNLPKIYGISSEDIYNNLKDQEKPLCLVCKGNVKFRGWVNGYDKTCSYKCGAKITIKKAKEEFKEKGNKIHKNKYDYSKVNYIDGKTKVKIICPIHGEFEQKPNHHLTGRGCPACGIMNNGQQSGWTRERYIGEKATLYFIKIKDSENLYKIGITKKTLKVRFAKDYDKIETIKEKLFSNGEEAFDIEQSILKVYKDSRINEEKILKNGNTEILTINKSQVKDIMALMEVKS